MKDSIKLGFKTVAADLLYRTPNQDIKQLKKQLDRFFEFGVHSISTYSLELSIRQGILSKQLPSEEMDQKMFYFINDYMKKRDGYIQHNQIMHIKIMFKRRF